MKLEYTGLKAVGGETAFMEETGIRWFPGDVHDVSEAAAKKMLEHATMWKSTDADVTAGGKPVAAIVPSPGVPAWALAGIKLDLTDEQLESIAQAGGPGTTAGAKLWTELSGQPIPEEFKAPELPPEPKYILRLPDATVRILDGLSREKLLDLAAELRVRVHPATGVPKLLDALMAAYK